MALWPEGQLQFLLLSPPTLAVTAGLQGGWRDVVRVWHLAEGIRGPKEQQAQKRISPAQEGAGRGSGAQVIPSGSVVFIVRFSPG